MFLQPLHDDALGKPQIYLHLVFKWVDIVHCLPPPHPLPPSHPFCWEGELSLLTNFQKGGLAESHFLDGDAVKKGVNFLWQGGCSFYTSRILNLKYLMVKKICKQKMFFLILSKNLNREF